MTRAYDARLEVGIEFLFLTNLNDLTVFEEDGDPAFESSVFPTDPQVINVVPAVHMERIIDHRCAQQKADLITGHADFDLVEIILFD